jgi:hypothetical protein
MLVCFIHRFAGHNMKIKMKAMWRCIQRRSSRTTFISRLIYIANKLPEILYEMQKFGKGIWRKFTVASEPSRQVQRSLHFYRSDCVKINFEVNKVAPAHYT